MCPAALKGVNINGLLKEIIDKRVYEEDYETITLYFQKERIDYSDAISVVKKIIETGVF